MDARHRPAACVVLAILIPAPPAGAAPAASPSAQAKAALDRLATYAPGAAGNAKRSTLDTIEQLVVPCEGNEAERKAVAQHLAGMLKSAGVTPDGKEIACRLLRLVGGPEEVPALAALLGDARLSFMARHALGRMDCPEAAEALRKALGELRGPPLVGTIHAVGDRGDALAVAALAKLARAPEADVAAAAVSSLGKIGTPEALAALDALPAPADKAMGQERVEARLLCAHRLADGGKSAEAASVFRGLLSAEHPVHVRMAGLRGLARAPSIDWLDAVIPLMREPKLGHDAALAVVALAETPSRADPRVVVALKKVSEVTEDAELRARAAAALKKLE